MTRPKSKPRMPKDWHVQADEAIVRHRKRKWIPDILEVEGIWECPFATQDRNRWWALMFEILGTRQTSIFEVFVRQLENLVPKEWSQEDGGWKANENAIRAMLSIIASQKPRNEAEAAYCAQLCALHFAAMKLGERISATWGGDDRAIAILNKTVRAYGDGLLNMQRLKGKGRKTVQVIKVETYRHDHQHVHIDRGGAENGGQPHAKPADSVARLPPVRNESPDGAIVPLPGNEGQARLPDARRRTGKRGAERKG